MSLFVTALPAAFASEPVSICYNYGCLNIVTVRFSERQLQLISDQLKSAHDPAEERELIGQVIGRLLGWIGKKTPIGADRGGNYADAAVHGRMDCIDHSTTTTHLLEMLERRGWLRWHRVLPPEMRSTLLFFQHFSAVIEEKTPPPLLQNSNAVPERYVVDSWFRDNGEPAVILPLDEWLAGAGTIETKGEWPHGSIEQ
jgi:hypothetical protein